MSISAIPPGFAGTGILPGARQGRDPEQVSNPVGQAPAHAPTEVAPAPRQNGAVPAEAPAGTDPALWQVLTPEERSFFARARTMGPLTYGPGNRNDRMAGVAQGGRIDVRV